MLAWHLSSSALMFTAAMAVRILGKELESIVTIRASGSSLNSVYAVQNAGMFLKNGGRTLGIWS